MAKQLLFCILTHDGPKQTSRLLKAIYNEQDQFVIHVDQSASPDYRAFVVEITRGLENVRVLSTRTCSWGGFSLVQAELDMLRIGMATNAGWSHAVLLSGTHLPLWTLDRIRKYMPAGKSLLGWHGSLPSGNETWLDELKSRIEWDYEEQSGVGMVRGIYIGPPDFRYYKGPQWNVLARPHVRYILGRGPDEIFRRLSRSNVADEAFFQTMLFNSRFGEEYENRWITKFVWRPPSPSPETLGYAQYQELLSSPDQPFVRKIKEDIAEEAEMDALIEAVSGQPAHPVLLSNISQASIRRN